MNQPALSSIHRSFGFINPQFMQEWCNIAWTLVWSLWSRTCQPATWIFYWTSGSSSNLSRQERSSNTSGTPQITCIYSSFWNISYQSWCYSRRLAQNASFSGSRSIGCSILGRFYVATLSTLAGTACSFFNAFSKSFCSLYAYENVTKFQTTS